VIRHRFSTVRIGALLICLLTVSACSSSSGAPDRPDSRRAEQELAARFAAAGVGFSLPLDAYRLTPQQQSVVMQVEDRLYRRCMAKLGYPLEARPLPEVQSQPNRDRFMLADEEAARTRGYHPPASVPAGDAEQPPASPSAEELTAENGRGPYRISGGLVPVGGCRGEATRVLTSGQQPPEADFVENLRNFTWGAAQRDHRVVKVFADWSACMNRSGLHYRNPMDANNDPAFATLSPSNVERATAVADVRCKKEVRLVQTWAAVEAEYQRRGIDENGPRLEAIAKATRIQAKAAEDLVARK
jgi:hypothetical protein